MSVAGNHQVTRDASLMKRLQPGLAAQAAVVAPVTVPAPPQERPVATSPAQVAGPAQPSRQESPIKQAQPAATPTAVPPTVRQPQPNMPRATDVRGSHPTATQAVVISRPPPPAPRPPINQHIPRSGGPVRQGPVSNPRVETKPMTPLQQAQAQAAQAPAQPAPEAKPEKAEEPAPQTQTETKPVD